MAEASDQHSERLVEDSRVIEGLQHRLSQALAKFGYSEQACFGMRLALEEAVMNGFLHGNRQDPTKFVEVKWVVTPEVATFHVIDQGEGFDPDAVPDPTLDENLEIPSGRGIMLIRAYMTEAHFETPGNHLVMTYRKKVAT